MFRPIRATATVVAHQFVTPNLRRLVLQGHELQSLLANPVSATPGAWVKVIPPNCSARAYTIRRFDLQESQLELDFVLHGSPDDSSVSAWAAKVQLGELIEVAGPRAGSFALRPDSAWVWLTADATGFPAAFSILEALPGGVEVYLACPVRWAKECLASMQGLVTDERCRGKLHLVWLEGNGESVLAELSDQLRTLGPNGQIWIAGEAGLVRTWRQHCLQLHKRDQIHAQAYWKVGELDHRDREAE